MSFVRLGVFFLLCSAAFGAEIRLSKSNESTLKEIEACILEARANVEFYEARVNSASSLIRRAKEEVKVQTLRFDRNRKLYEKKAVAASELEETERDLNQSVIDVELAGHILSEKEAELKGSKARLTQSEEGNCVRIPPH